VTWAIFVALCYPKIAASVGSGRRLYVFLFNSKYNSQNCPTLGTSVRVLVLLLPIPAIAKPRPKNRESLYS